MDTGRTNKHISRIQGTPPKFLLDSPSSGKKPRREEEIEKLKMDLLEEREMGIRREAQIKNEMTEKFAKKMLKLEQSYNKRYMEEISQEREKFTKKMQIQSNYYLSQIEDLQLKLDKATFENENFKKKLNIDYVTPSKMVVVDRPGDRDSAVLYECEVSSNPKTGGINAVITDYKKISKKIADFAQDKNEFPSHIGDNPKLKKQLKNEKNKKEKNKRGKKRKSEDDSLYVDTSEQENKPPELPHAQGSFRDVSLGDSFSNSNKKPKKTTNDNVLKPNNKHDISFGDLTPKKASPSPLKKKKDFYDKLPVHSKVEKKGKTKKTKK